VTTEVLSIPQGGLVAPGRTAVTVDAIDLAVKSDRRQFIDFGYDLYKGHRYAVPPIRSDVELMLNPRKHPFYEHSAAEFFIARRDGRVVGRIAALENRPFNAAHSVHQAHFYLFDAENDPATATLLFERVRDWARSRGLDEIMGPMGFGPLNGPGILVDGFEQRQLMSMMPYNEPYYVDLIEAQGFEPAMDYVSLLARRADFALPDQAYRVAERVLARGTLRVQGFRSQRELRAWAPKVGEVYNRAFVSNPIYYPLSERELQMVVEEIQLVGDPHLIKVILDGDEVVGFMLVLPDLSAAMQRIKGRLWPFGFLRLLLERRRTKWASFFAIGVLPGYRARGGHTLLYTEIEKTMRASKFEFADLTQSAETAVVMRREALKMGAVPYKRHRVYRRPV
jgi:hypothetical protein